MSSLSSPAFAAPISLLTAVRTPFHGTATRTTRPPQIASRPATRASLSDKKSTRLSRAEEDRLAKKESEYRGPQGFTPYAEKVNGRIAQLGFVIGLVTELASGKPIGEQILYMFAPLTHLASSLAVLAANAQIEKLTL